LPNRSIYVIDKIGFFGEILYRIRLLMASGAMRKEDDNGRLTVITTHVNADFDALASMLAAQKLYPDALVVFPGSQEKNLRNFFIQSMVYLFNMADIKEIDLDKVKRLVLVDTRQPGRIGKLASLLDRADVEIHIYDHHPDMAGDIKGHFELIETTGATATLLTKVIEEKKIDLSADEATILCLGIYEDTGSFSFPSTTEKDFMAAAALLSKGANLNIVSNLIDREMNPAQVGLLNDMIQAANHYNIHGVDIVVTCVSSEAYVPDFAFLVHKMMRMENLNAIFAIARMVNKVYIIARSKTSEVDVGTILSPLGGGGHTYAAAATIRGKTLVQIEHLLVGMLYQSVRSRRQAENLMSSPPIMVDSEVACKDANNLLTRYNVNALLVTEDRDGQKNLLGYITRQVIEKALYHKLDDVPVRDYMSTEIESVQPEANLPEIQEKIIESKQRILPVVKGEKILGVITRTDLLNILVGQSPSNELQLPDPTRETVHARIRNIVKFLRERLSERFLTIFEKIGETADQLGFKAYVAGGFVRDLFLYRPNEDIDIVIEGDGIAFAKKYAKMCGARIHSYAKFGTAVIIFPDGFKIDVASARMEYYKSPAALPTVEMSSIKLDLFRRDFTINTLAIELNPDRFGTLIDFFNAQKDIKAKAIRVLHNLSFVEDPTRVFRAIRFEQRFGFTIGRLTAGLIENAVRMGFFKQLSGRRVWGELRQILEEENPMAALVRLNDFDLLGVIHPAIVMDEEMIALFNSTRQVTDWFDLLFLEESYMKWAAYFLALIRSCDRETSRKICKRLELAPRMSVIFCQERFEAERCLYWLERNLPAKNSDLYKRLAGFRTELVLSMMAATRKQVVKRSISRYFTHLRYIQPSLRGQDLVEMGIEPGPIYRRILEAVQDAKLNEELKSKKDEIEFIRRFIS
jgi:tRNA nucleotidyltransferase (CCA-adding enzyme)